MSSSPSAQHLFRYLDTVGDGSGSKNANGAGYSVGSPGIFKIQPPAGQVISLERMIVQIEDDGVPNAEKYGALAALTNGILVRIANDAGTIVELTDGLPIKSNSHWARLCYDVSFTGFASGNDFVDVRWTFAKSGRPVVLGDTGDNERLEVVCQDALDGLIGHTFKVQGFIIKG